MNFTEEVGDKYFKYKQYIKEILEKDKQMKKNLNPIKKRSYHENMRKKLEEKKKKKVQKEQEL